MVQRVGLTSTTRVFLTPALPSCLTLGRYLSSPKLYFPIYKMEITTIPVSVSCSQTK